MAYNVTKYSIHSLKESIKRNTNYDTVSLNSDKCYPINGIVETRQGDTLSNSTFKSDNSTSEEFKIQKESQEKVKIKIENILEETKNNNDNKEDLSKIEEAITEMLNARGEEYIKLRIDCNNQEIKEIDCRPENIFDYNAQNVEKFKKKITEVLAENRTKLNRLKEQLEFGKAKLIQANKSIAHLSGIKKSHETIIEEQIRKRDNALQINYPRFSPRCDPTSSGSIGSTNSAEKKSLGYKISDLETNGCKALQNIQNLLEQNKFIIKGIEEKEITVKAKISKIEDDRFYDAESTSERNLL